MKIIFSLFIVALLVLSGCSSQSNPTKEPFPAPQGLLDTTTDKNVIIFFWGDGCPHCEEEEKFLSTLQTQYPELEIRSAETWKSKANAQIYMNMAKAYGETATGVPGTFVGDKFISGFGTPETTGAEILRAYLSCKPQGCENPAAIMLETVQ